MRLPQKTQRFLDTGTSMRACVLRCTKVESSAFDVVNKFFPWKCLLDTLFCYLALLKSYEAFY